MDLIPGLTDDLARECLIRIPLKSSRSVSSVCKAWDLEIRSPHFHHRRKLSGQTRPLFILAKIHRVYSQDTASKNSPNIPLSYLLTFFDPEARSWTRLPLGPGLPDEYLGLCGVIGVGSKVIVIGVMWNQGSGPVNTVHVFDFLTCQWYCRSNTRPGRVRFGLAGDPIRGRVLIAGGYGDQKRALKSAIMYDVENDRWTHLNEMKTERDECNVVCHAGKLHAISSRSAESLDLDTLEWGPVDNQFLDNSMRDKSWVVTGNYNGELYYMGLNVAVRRGSGERWQVISKVPDELQYRKCVMTWQDKLVVIGGQVFCGPHKTYVFDLKSGEWSIEDLPTEFSSDAFVLGCGMEL